MKKQKMIMMGFMIIALLLSILDNNAGAQSTIIAAGSSAKNSAGSISFSVGQIDYLVAKSANASVSQGVQQPVHSSTLPVTLLSFTANKKGQRTDVKWSTTNEINAARFDVQRSNDGTAFTTIHRQTAAGTRLSKRNYEIVDARPLKGWNYYRLQIVDKDNSFVYSKVAAVNFGAALINGLVYPNPVKQSFVLKIPGGNSGLLSYKLLNPNGQLLINKGISTSETTIDISNLVPGIYFLKIFNQDNQEINSTKIIKSN